jgi:Flp pilus assembly protein TadD
MVADVLAHEGQLDEAIEVVRPAAEAGKWNAREKLSLLLARAGRVPEAVAVLGPNGTGLGHLAQALGRDGRFDEAIAVVRKRAVDHPDSGRSSIATWDPNFSMPGLYRNR